MASTLQPISIWQPQIVNGEPAFVRPDPLPLGDHYADQKTIFKNKKPNCKRICFFGESAAAGYLYAPHLSPAKVLESQLLEVCEKPDFEVVDLAMTNETLHGLVAKVERSLQLQPDLLVIFTGNNWTMLETPEWSPYFPASEARLAYAHTLKEEGIPGIIKESSLQVLRKVSSAFAQIHQLANTAAVPVILVIPEVNLADWENRQAPLWLPAGKTAQWYSLYEQALDHLQKKEWQKAEETAWQMEELDACTCPTTYRLLAKAFLGQGEEHKAQQALQAEVDSNRYATLAFLGAPQINSGGRSLQKKLAQLYGFSEVDLRKVFALHTQSVLPGRRLFLDYCHLTPEGMKVGMAAVTAKVLLLSGHAKKGVSWEKLVQQLPDPSISPEADATAKLGAAIHTAHRHLTVGEEGPILEYWCRAALAASPDIRHSMQDFVAARLAQIPAVLTAAQGRNLASPYKFTMQHGWKYDYLDVAAIQAIKTVTDLALDQLVGNKWRAKEKVDLIHPPFHLWQPVERFYPEVMSDSNYQKKAFFRAAWPESSFALVGRFEEVLQLEVVFRLPHIPGWKGKRKGSVSIKFNQETVRCVQLGEQWKKATFSIRRPPPAMAIHQITLVWPPPPACGEEAINGAIARLAQGMEADLHPVFGEVFSLEVLNPSS